jgi:hypothetical protein
LSFTENGDNPHRLCTTNRLTELALVLPSELGFVSGVDAAQLRDKVTKEDAVVYFVERVDAELVEDVVPDGKGFPGT